MSSIRVPTMSHHKASGQAVVRLNYRDHYLGPWRSRAARVAYDRLIAEWLAAGRQDPQAEAVYTVTQMIAAFWVHAKNYYRNPDGSDTGELHCFRDALRPLRQLYGDTPAAAFGPLALKAVRQVMIEKGHCRTEINRRIGRVRRVFKWATENELVPPTVLHGLQAVSGLRAGRCGVRESEPVKPVSEALVEATLPHVSRQVAAMVRLQLLTGMRPGEVVLMRGADLDMSGKLWLYRPRRHKTAYLGHERLVYIGPRAQEIIRPFLVGDPNRFLFSPAQAERERRQRLHALRTTPDSCGNRPGSNVKRRPARQPADCYTVNSYAHAIKYGCRKAFPLPQHLDRLQLPKGRRETVAAWRGRLSETQKQEIRDWHRDHHWHPHRLRHTAATNLRKQYGLEPAQVILGHKTLTVTQVYAERNVAAAIEVMSEAG